MVLIMDSIEKLTLNASLEKLNMAIQTETMLSVLFAHISPPKNNISHKSPQYVFRGS